MQNSIRSRKNKKICCRKSEKTWWADHPLCSRVKQSVETLSFGKRLVFANQTLVQERVNCIPTQCVRLCQQNFTRVGNLAHLNSDRTRPEVLKIWSCPTSNAWDLFVKMEALLQKPGRKKKTASVLVDVFCFHCKTDFGAMWCFYCFCPCQEIRPSLTEADIKCDNKRRELDELRRNYIKQKSFALTEIWECYWWKLQNWH